LILFSTEALMRELGSIPYGRLTTVIGYGRIGSSIAHHLQSRGVTTSIVEHSPVRGIEAKAHGFVLRCKSEALRRGNLVFCATGNRALVGEDFLELRSGSYVASATSADDELDLGYARATYDVTQVTDHIERFDRRGQYFYLLNGGNAVNFVHRGGLGPFILPVQGEIVSAVAAILSDNLDAGLQEMTPRLRDHVATEWLRVFESVNTD
jgi:adenosylhomocysteinase